MLIIVLLKILSDTSVLLVFSVTKLLFFIMLIIHVIYLSIFIYMDANIDRLYIYMYTHIYTCMYIYIQIIYIYFWGKKSLKNGTGNYSKNKYT